MFVNAITADLTPGTSNITVITWCVLTFLLTVIYICFAHRVPVDDLEMDHNIMTQTLLHSKCWMKTLQKNSAEFLVELQNSSIVMWWCEAQNCISYAFLLGIRESWNFSARHVFLEWWTPSPSIVLFLCTSCHVQMLLITYLSLFHVLPVLVCFEITKYKEY